MSRKPAHDLRPNETRQAIWDWIRKQGGCEFMTTDVDVPLESSTIRDYLAGLHKAGHLEAIRIGIRGEANIYRLIKDTGREAPRVRKDGSLVTQGLAREQMWRQMGIFAQKGQPFTVRDLTAVCPLAAESDAKHYCVCLHNAGVLLELKPGKSGQLTVYKMLAKKWTGPKPVQIQRTRRCFDPNTGSIVHLQTISVEGGE